MLVWLDGRTEHAAAAAGELRPRDHGAVHVRRRQLHRAGRVRRGARVHRLEPARSSAARRRSEQLLRVRLQRRTSTTRRRRRSRSRSTANGSSTIPARAAADGMQDGIDFITALARASARRRGGWRASCGTSSSARSMPPDPAFVDGASRASTCRTTPSMKPVVRYMLRSRWFHEPGQLVRALLVAGRVRRPRDQGGRLDGLLGRHARATPLTNMGQTLFEPPDVNGWELGQGWFSTGAMLARMNFAATLAANQRFNLRATAAGAARVAGGAARVLPRRLSPAPFDDGAASASCSTTCAPAARGPGPTRSCNAKAAGLARLIVGSAEYQFV